MKYVLIPLAWYIFNSTAIDTDFKITKGDTIYQYIKTEPHHCEYFGCPLEGELVFYSTSRSTKDILVEELHFQHPLLSQQMCIDLIEYRLKRRNL